MPLIFNERRADPYAKIRHAAIVTLVYRSRDSKSRLSRINDARRRRSSVASVVKPP